MSVHEAKEETSHEDRLALSKQERARAKNYKLTFESKTGKEVLADLARFTGQGQEPFFPGQPDQTAYCLGQQSVIRRIQEFLLMTDMDLYREVKNYEVKLRE